MRFIPDISPNVVPAMRVARVSSSWHTGIDAIEMLKELCIVRWNKADIAHKQFSQRHIFATIEVKSGDAL
jgi:hypothetical protein